MFKNIVLFPKIQIDTAISYFILKTFGEKKFPGVSEAELVFWTKLPEDRTPGELEQAGYILIDLGNGQFDHHRLGPENRKYSSAHLVAQALEVDDLPELQKLLELARRDDLLGKGTVSIDALDRSFGLPGMLMSLVKTYPNNPKYILDVLFPIIYAHYYQEVEKYQKMPQEYKDSLAKGLAQEINATQLGKQLKVVLINSDNIGLAGYVRSRAVGADLVIQRASTGHVNFISNQKSQLQLGDLARKIKLLEAQKNNLILEIDSMDELTLPGKTDGLPHWYYDTRANTLQNGGISPGDIPATLLSDEEIVVAIKGALNISRNTVTAPVSNNRFSQNKGKQNNNYKKSNYGQGREYRGAIIID